VRFAVEHRRAQPRGHEKGTVSRRVQLRGHKRLDVVASFGHVTKAREIRKIVSDRVRRMESHHVAADAHLLTFRFCLRRRRQFTKTLSTMQQLRHGNTTLQPGAARTRPRRVPVKISFHASTARGPAKHCPIELFNI
jgi:predicted DNA-binding protein